MDKSFKKGDRVVLIDDSRTAGIFPVGSQGVVVEHENGRVLIIFDGETREVSGNENRFRMVTKLDKALR